MFADEAQTYREKPIHQCALYVLRTYKQNGSNLDCQRADRLRDIREHIEKGHVTFIQESLMVKGQFLQYRWTWLCKYTT